MPDIVEINITTVEEAVVINIEQQIQPVEINIEEPTSSPGSGLSQGDNVSLLNNDAGYISSIPSSYIQENDNISRLINDANYVPLGANISSFINDEGYVKSVNAGAFPFYNIKDFGAVGDGVTDDQNAFDLALAALPAGGGTIFLPEGVYLMTSAVLHRDNVRILGEGSNKSFIKTVTPGANGVEISVYRRGGWVTALDQIVPYEDTLRVGQSWIKPKDPADLAKYSPGDKIFIAAGSSAQFDQEYGEFNRVKKIDNVNDRIILEKNLLRDYRADYSSFNALVAADFVTPALNSTVDIQVEVLTNDGEPGSLKGISIGNDLYEFVSSTSGGNPIGGNTYTWTVRNIHSTNAVGATVKDGDKIYKQRVIIKTPETYSGTVLESIGIIADGDTVNLSNSMDTLLKDVYLYRDDATGGLWADMDDGRNARFVRCKIESAVWDACQPARSFGELVFEDCEFINAAIDYSEFCSNGQVLNSRFYMEDLEGNAGSFSYAISLGWSTSNMRVEGCEIHGEEIGSLIDTEPDINGYRGVWRGGFTIKNNWLYGTNIDRFMRLNQVGTTEVSGNHMFGNCVSIFSAEGHEFTAGSDGTINLEGFFINSSYLNIHHNFFAGSCDTVNLAKPFNIVMEDNWFHWVEDNLSVTSNFNLGSIIWDNPNQGYPNMQMCRIRRNTFKNWKYADGSVGGPGTPQPSFNFDPSDYGGGTVRMDISQNLILDAQQDYIDAGSPLSGLSEFIVDTYITP